LKCVEKRPESLVLVVVPKRDLLSQWSQEIRQEFPDAIIRRVESDEKDWPSKVSVLINASSAERRRFVVTTIQSGSKEKFIDLVSRVPPNQLAIIVDEVHHSGAPEYSNIFRIKEIGRAHV